MTKSLGIATVMKRVARFEEKRITRWLFWLVPSLVIGLAVSVHYGTRVWSSLIDLGIFDLISSLTGDFESARATVVENIGLFWEFLPKRSLIISSFTLILVLAMIIFNRKTLRNFPQRISSILKYLRQKGGDD